MISRPRAMWACLGLALATVAVAAPASAAPTNLLDTHGTFEQPVTPGFGKTYRPGSTFDGWEVRNAHVSLARRYRGVIDPPQGHQSLVLVNASKVGLQRPGAVCRVVTTEVGHRYQISFLAGIVDKGHARIVARLGQHSARVALPHGRYPVVFKPYHVTLRSDDADGELCFSASNVTSNAFPAIDAAKVVDVAT